jgi:uncharacterized protein (UPF0332 family)
MDSAATARAHLVKAKEFLQAARLSHEAELFNAACSAAVSAGINAKDAICLRFTGTCGKTENHAQAIAELKRSGPVVRDLAENFARLLRLKPMAQYFAQSLSSGKSASSISWAERLVAAAGDCLRGSV